MLRRFGHPLDYMTINDALRELDRRRRRREQRRDWLLWLAWALLVAGLTYGAFWPSETLP